MAERGLNSQRHSSAFLWSGLLVVSACRVASLRNHVADDSIGHQGMASCIEVELQTLLGALDREKVDDARCLELLLWIIHQLLYVNLDVLQGPTQPGTFIIEEQSENMAFSFQTMVILRVSTVGGSTGSGITWSGAGQSSANSLSLGRRCANSG